MVSGVGFKPYVSESASEDTMTQEAINYQRTKEIHELRSNLAGNLSNKTTDPSNEERWQTEVDEFSIKLKYVCVCVHKTVNLELQ